VYGRVEAKTVASGFFALHAATEKRTQPVPQVRQMPLGQIGLSRDYRSQVRDKVLDCFPSTGVALLVVRRAL
jgi:hypothetical protein